MFLKKPNSHFPLVNDEGFQGKKSVANGGRSQRKSIESDHWHFLEEFDAPMWVDLTLESKSMHQDIDDAWFKISHPFHQSSSRELISVFSDLGEEKANSDLLEPSSPKLPPSVSQSRGKHYRSRKWKGGDHTKSVAKPHPIRVLGWKTLPVVSRSIQEVKPKTSFANSKRTSNLKAKARSEPNFLQTKPRFGTTECTSSLKTNSVSESSSSETKKSDFTRTKTSFGDSETTSSLNACSVCESNSASMKSPNSSNPISSSNDSKSSSNSSTEIVVQSSQSMSVSEAPNQIFGRTSGLLSAVKISLRRSIVTRQASRVEIKDGKQESNSSSSKSCVGSSSNSGFNLKNVNRTVNSRKVLTMAQPMKHNNQKGTYVSKSSSGQYLDLNSISRQKRIALASRSIYQETSKPKVLHQVERKKSSQVHNVQEQGSLTVGLKAKKIVVDSCKVYPVGPVGLNQKAGGKDNTFGSKVQCQKPSKNSSEVKDGKGLFDLKEKANGRNKGKNPKNVVQKKVYFR